VIHRFLYCFQEVTTSKHKFYILYFSEMDVPTQRIVVRVAICFVLILFLSFFLSFFSYANRHLMLFKIISLKTVIEVSKVLT